MLGMYWIKIVKLAGCKLMRTKAQSVSFTVGKVSIF